MQAYRDDNAWDEAWKSGLASEPVDFDAPTLENQIDQLKIQFLGRELPSRGSAIEVGCGSARLLLRVGSGTALDLFALDSSVHALRLARVNGRSVRKTLGLVRGEVRSLPFATGSCDLLLSGGLLEHFADPRPLLAEMLRVLRPGGVFYADVVPRRLSLFRLRELPRVISSPWLMRGVYESSFGPRQYRTWLHELGCRDIRMQSCGVYPPWRPLFWSRWTQVFDGTLLARLLGWYFMIVARKAG